MGRYNFRPQRVRQAVSELLGTGRLQAPPPWYDVIGTVPPSQTLVRTQPIQHRNKPATKKPSKLYKPQKVRYYEDKLRREFFGDHPWELARPRIVLENNGMDSRGQDWSKIRQPGQPLTGENVIQRQSWLMHNIPNMTKTRAYDQARHEFYEARLQEDVERQVAKEEAMATGAYFGKSMLEVGMELEDREYERWKKWALEQMELTRLRRAAAYSGVPTVDDPETSTPDELDPSLPVDEEDKADAVP